MAGWALATATLVACSAEEEVSQPPVDGRGTWMLITEWQTTTEGELVEDSTRAVATKLDSDDVAVVIDHVAYARCQGPTDDIVRASHWDDGRIESYLLRLSPTGFAVEPDLLPAEIFGYGECPVLWEPDRAVVFGATTKPRRDDDLERGLYLTTAGGDGSATAVRIDAGTGMVNGAARWTRPVALTPDKSELFYSTLTTSGSEVFRVDLEADPPTPVLVDRISGVVGLTASQEWLLYESDDAPHTMRAFPLQEEGAAVVELAIPESTEGRMWGYGWRGEDRLVFSKDEGTEARLWLFSATSEPEVTLLSSPELRPISGIYVDATLDTVVFGFQRGVAETRTKGIARVDPREPTPTPTVVFEFPANDPYSSIDSLRGSHFGNELLLQWTDAQAMHRITAIDTLSGETADLEAYAQSCEAQDAYVVSLDREASTLAISCTIDGRRRAFAIDRNDPSRRFWLDDFPQDEDEALNSVTPNLYRGPPGVVTWTAVGEVDGSRSEGAITFYSLSGVLRAQRRPGRDDWRTTFPVFMTLE